MMLNLIKGVRFDGNTRDFTKSFKYFSNILLCYSMILRDIMIRRFIDSNSNLTNDVEYFTYTEMIGSWNERGMPPGEGYANAKVSREGEG